MELNGVANIKILVDQLNPQDNTELIAKINEQLDTMERYMIAYRNAANSNTEAPAWHEVRDNKQKYPKANGR